MFTAQNATDRLNGTISNYNEMAQALEFESEEKSLVPQNLASFRSGRDLAKTFS